MTAHRVTLCISACGMDTKSFRYPTEWRGRVKVVPVNWPPGRQGSFEEVCTILPAALTDGNVAVHCNHGVHRSPLLAAAFVRFLDGTEVPVTLRWLDGVRYIWRGYRTLVSGGDFGPRPEPRDAEMADTYQWAQGIAAAQTPTTGAASRGPALVSAKRPRVTGEAASSHGPAASSQGTAAQSPATPLQFRYVYRTMRSDGRDLVAKPNPPVWWTGEELAYQMLRAVELGSTYQSWFCHASWNFFEARLWYMRAAVERKARDHYIVRIDLDKLDRGRSSTSAPGGGPTRCSGPTLRRSEYSGMSGRRRAPSPTRRSC